jgi:hypothetical protein
VIGGVVGVGRVGGVGVRRLGVGGGGVGRVGGVEVVVALALALSTTQSLSALHRN